jgi:hypothetical protein
MLFALALLQFALCILVSVLLVPLNEFAELDVRTAYPLLPLTGPAAPANRLLTAVVFRWQKSSTTIMMMNLLIALVFYICEKNC